MEKSDFSDSSAGPSTRISNTGRSRSTGGRRRKNRENRIIGQKVLSRRKRLRNKNTERNYTRTHNVKSDYHLRPRRRLCAQSSSSDIVAALRTNDADSVGQNNSPKQSNPKSGSGSDECCNMDSSDVPDSTGSEQIEFSCLKNEQLKHLHEPSESSSENLTSHSRSNEKLCLDSETTPQPLHDAITLSNMETDLLDDNTEVCAVAAMQQVPIERQPSLYQQSTLCPNQELDRALSDRVGNIGVAFLSKFNGYLATLQNFLHGEDILKRFFSVSSIIRFLHGVAMSTPKEDAPPQIFELPLGGPTERTLPDAPIRRQLGYCVQYSGACAPHIVTRCEFACAECDVCSHMYRCDCPPENKFYGWCRHIHAAVSGGRNKFEHRTVVFFHRMKNRAKLAHFRALCYDQNADVVVVGGGLGDEFAVRSPGAEERGEQTVNVKLMRRLVRCRKTRCATYKKCPLCDICRHQVECDCPDYRQRKLLCEHCHVVAMLEAGSRDRLMRIRTFQQQDDSCETDEDSDDEASPAPQSDTADEASANKRRRLSRVIRAHHERSYAIPDENVSEISFFLDEENEVYEVTSANESSRRSTVVVKYKSCDEHVGESSAYKCWDCQTCDIHYTCIACPNTIFCKHKHKVHACRENGLFSDEETDD